MSQIYEILHSFRSLGLHPLAVVIIAALLAALLEQRVARRGAPDYNAAYRDLPVYPNLPPRGRRRRKPAPAPKADAA
jgi:hypothetical protein